METVKYIPFMIFFTSSILALDAYFLYSWRNTAKRNKWKSISYQLPIIVGILMGFVSLYTIWIQIGDILPGKFEKILFDLQSIWYLPKAVITPILIFRDIWRFADKKFSYKNLKNNIFKLKKFLIRNTALTIQPTFALQTHSKVIDYSGNSSEDNYLLANEPKLQPENKHNHSRRKFVKNSSWALAGVPFVIVSRGALETTYDFNIHNAEIHLNKLPFELDGIKIVHISDLHAGSFHSPEPMQEVARIINNLKPDIVAVTGDFVNYKPEEYNIISDAIASIKSSYGNFGCLGNHDHFMSRRDTELLRDSINSSNVKLLDNANAQIEINGSKLQIAGIDNNGYGQTFGDFEKALDGLSDDNAKILLAHDPTNWDNHIKGQRKVELTLSGHTHGGQAGINIGGKLITPAMFVYKQFAGLYKTGDQYLYINRGLGNSGIPIRVGVPPEITLITLRSYNKLNKCAFSFGR